ncbi:BstXI family restriction endonuclease [Saccharopolyspora sp. MS10]|uniref:BstXI family restriction endonuclease n=1 Tax=Saccharopolyspora sp. MS10 TaxID=3385973 RepID=UPI00399FA323
MSPSRPAKVKLPHLPQLVRSKLDKVNYTRGASNRELFQNRVSRNNRVLINWESWSLCKFPDDETEEYEKGFCVLVSPSWYFENPNADEELAAEGIEIGTNAVIFFQRRQDWEVYSPKGGVLSNGKEFTPANSRENPVGGTYCARIHATVSDGATSIEEGFNSNKTRGAGIRVYEYASSQTMADAELQLEAMLWHCYDAEEVMIDENMSPIDVSLRKGHQLEEARQRGLLNIERLQTVRMIDRESNTVCPLCLERISATDFFKRSKQADGRETYDLTTTEISLFHIQELRVGNLLHKSYNLGWGHHFCNVVAKDAGIIPTLKWMKSVLDNQPQDETMDEAKHSVEQAVEG